MRRTAQEVINEAIDENRANEMLLYGLSLISFLLGVAVIVWSLYRNQPIATLAGAIESTLFAPAVYFIRQIRRENIKLRLMELPLSSAKTAEEAAKAIITLFAEEFRDTKGRGTDVAPKTVR